MPVVSDAQAQTGTVPEPIESHNPDCYVCGERNPAALGLSLASDGETISGEVALGERHQGAPGLAHGGAVAALLDEILGIAVHLRGIPAVTARLEVDYRRPFVLGRRHLVAASVDEQEGRKYVARGSVRDEEGALVAEGTGLFVQVPVEHFLENLPPEWRTSKGDAGNVLPW